MVFTRRSQINDPTVSLANNLGEEKSTGTGLTSKHLYLSTTPTTEAWMT